MSLGFASLVTREEFDSLCARVSKLEDSPEPELTLSERLIQIVGTADPEEIRMMLDQAKDSWRPPVPKLPR